MAINTNVTIKIIADGIESDISALVEDMSIYEDMYANFMSGYLTMVDSRSLFEKIPLIGEEDILIEFNTFKDSERKFNHTFAVYKIDEIGYHEAHSYTAYTVYFASREMLVSKEKRIAKSFGASNAKIATSNIATEILKDFLGIEQKRINIETTSTNVHFVSPRMEPIRVLNHLAEISSASSAPRSPMLFFEERDKYHFVSYKTLFNNALYDKTPIKDIIFDPTSDILPEGVFIPQNKAYRMKILPFDVLQNTAHGMYGSKTYHFDILNKTLQAKEFSYSKEFQAMDHVDKPKDNFIRNNQCLPSGKTLLLSERYFDDNHIANAYSLQQQLENWVLQLEMMGNSALRLGQVVNFDVPTTLKMQQTKTVKKMSGKYLVTRIRHNFAGEKYFLQIELRRGVFTKI